MKLLAFILTVISTFVSINVNANQSYINGTDNMVILSTPPTRTFANEQYVYGFLANHSFKHSSGLIIKFDSKCQVYIDGDWVAGAISVLRYDATSALIQFNSPIYGTNRLLVKIANDKLELVDTKDQSVYRQYK